MAVLPLDDTGMINAGLDLIPLTPEHKLADWTYQIPLPGIFYWPFDWVQKGINWIRNSDKGAPGQEPKKTPTLGAAAGGPMKYRGHWLNRSYFPDAGESVYKWIKNKALADGFAVNEMDYYSLNNKHSYPYPIQAHEDGREIDLMSYDKDGSRVSGWKMAREIAHEYVGATYFTRRGKSHTSNESRIQKLADDFCEGLKGDLYPELARAA